MGWRLGDDIEIVTTEVSSHSNLKRFNRDYMMVQAGQLVVVGLAPAVIKAWAISV